MTEQLEFKKGDYIVFTWGDKLVRKIELKPKFKSRILHLTVSIEDRRRDVLAQWCRLATDEERELGYRQD